MKKLFTYGAVIMLFILSSFISTEDVVNAIRSGSASQLSKYFDNTIEITLTDKSNTYSKSQAELVVRDFFTTNSVKGFEIVHKGDNAGAQFIIGTLQTKNGPFRTTIYLKTRDGKQLLQEIRFEK